MREINPLWLPKKIIIFPKKKIIQAFRLLPKSIASDVFVNMEEEVQVNLITSLTNNEATQIIEDMFTDDAADLFEEMPAVMVSKLLSGVSKETRMQINNILCKTFVFTYRNTK